MVLVNIHNIFIVEFNPFFGLPTLNDSQRSGIGALLLKNSCPRRNGRRQTRVQLFINESNFDHLLRLDESSLSIDVRFRNAIGLHILINSNKPLAFTGDAVVIIGMAFCLQLIGNGFLGFSFFYLGHYLLH